METELDNTETPEPEDASPLPDGDQPPPDGEPRLAPAEDAPEKAALTITIQSWATPIVGVVMLIIGLAAGYYARPLLTRFSTTTPDSAASIPPPEQAGPPTSQPTSPEQAAQQKALMDTVVARVRHFRGDPNAPVILVEFSDFQ